MRLSRMTATALLLLLAACGAAATGSEIVVSDARVPVPAGANGAGYLTLANDGDADDRLVGASTDIAEAVELHESSMEGGSMSMRQLEGIDVPAGGAAVLEPGGLHLMLVGVTDELTVGDAVELTLEFAEAGEQTVRAEVVPLGDVEPMDMGSEPMEMGSDADAEG
jgi:copper(I)-binding protein